MHNNWVANRIIRNFLKWLIIEIFTTYFLLIKENVKFVKSYGVTMTNAEQLILAY